MNIHPHNGLVLGELNFPRLFAKWCQLDRERYESREITLEEFGECVLRSMQTLGLKMPEQVEVVE